MFSDSGIFNGYFGLYDELKREADKVKDVTKLYTFTSGFICESNVAYMKRYAETKDIDKLRIYLNFKGGVYLSNKHALDRYIALIKENIFTEKQWRETVSPSIEVFEFNRDLDRIVPSLNKCFGLINNLEDTYTRIVYVNKICNEFGIFGIFTNAFLENDLNETKLNIYSDLYIKIIKDMYGILHPFYLEWPDCLETIKQMIWICGYKDKIII